MTTDMRCAYCGSKKLWPRDFPSRIFAICHDCNKKNQEEEKKMNIYAFVIISIVLIIFTILILNAVN